MTYSYKAVLFDCDGVIVDTENLSNDLLRAMLKEQGLELDDQTLHDKFTGFTNQENLRNAEAMLGKALPTHFDAEYRDKFQALMEEQLEPIQGVTDLLSKIQTPIAMATNARRQEMNFKLNKIELAERFSTRFCVEDVEHGKPAPDLYLKAAKPLELLLKIALLLKIQWQAFAPGEPQACACLLSAKRYQQNCNWRLAQRKCLTT